MELLSTRKLIHGFRSSSNLQSRKVFAFGGLATVQPATSAAHLTRVTPLPPFHAFPLIGICLSAELGRLAFALCL